jgi:multidrug transporter EmrE-like cation transporter
MTHWIGNLGLIAIVALSLLGNQLLLKYGTRATGALSLSSPAEAVALIRQVLTTPALLAGYALSGLTALLWLVVVSRLDLSFAVPLLNGIFYVLLLLASATLLRETVTAARWAGALLILIGIALISTSGR